MQIESRYLCCLSPILESSAGNLYLKWLAMPWQWYDVTLKSFVNMPDTTLSCPLVPNEFKVVLIFPPKNRICDVKRVCTAHLLWIEFSCRIFPACWIWALFQCFIPSNKKRVQTPPLIHVGMLRMRSFWLICSRARGCDGIPWRIRGRNPCHGSRIYAAVKIILAELQISSFRPCLSHVVKKGGGTFIIELYNNYYEDIERLARFLCNEQEQPKW